MVANGNHHNANKTHCPRGHEYTASNTQIVTRKSGITGRRCAICKRDESRLYREQRKLS